MMTNISLEFIKDFIEELIKYPDIRRGRKLGEGSAREAYNINDELVLKVPRGAFLTEDERYSEELDTRFLYGLHQTAVEIDIWKSTDDYIKQILNPILLHGSYNDFVFEVQPMVEVAEDTEYRYEDILTFAKLADADFVPEDIYNDISNFLVDVFELGDGDIFDNCGNYGITTDNRVVLIDYGFQGWTKLNEFVKSNSKTGRVHNAEMDDTLWSDSSCSYSW